MLEAVLFYILVIMTVITGIVFLGAKNEKVTYITFSLTVLSISAYFLLINSVINFLALILYLIGAGFILHFSAQNSLYKGSPEKSRIKSFYALAFALISFVVLVYFVNNESYQTVFLIQQDPVFSLKGLQTGLVSMSSTLIHRYYFQLATFLFCTVATAIGLKIAFSQGNKGEDDV